MTGAGENMDKEKTKQKLLIADDYEGNRSLLREILGGDYDILEAEDGVETIEMLKEHRTDIAVLLLDIVMPRMNGYEVLEHMKKEDMLDDIPVIVISAESDAEYVEKAFQMGVTDYIGRPFGVTTVKRRVSNVLMLFAKQSRIVGMVEDATYEREKSNNMMLEVLSHIVEFRNGESGLHVMHMSIIVEILLKRLMQKTQRYDLSYSDIVKISTASSLHDIGKISIPEHILSKPGRLTKEEFEVVKLHTALGASMLQGVMLNHEDPLLRLAHDICRWHHEKYDGNGYPDGLKGDDIPIAAQVVSIADAFEVLISKRSYKEAYPHEVAVQMIVNGECGVFNPLLLECLIEAEQELTYELSVNSSEYRSRKIVNRMTQELLRKM